MINRYTPAIPLTKYGSIPFEPDYTTAVPLDYIKVKHTTTALPYVSEVIDHYPVWDSTEIPPATFGSDIFKIGYTNHKVFEFYVHSLPISEITQQNYSNGTGTQSSPWNNLIYAVKEIQCRYDTLYAPMCADAYIYVHVSGIVDYSWYIHAERMRELGLQDINWLNGMADIFPVTSKLILDFNGCTVNFTENHTQLDAVYNGKYIYACYAVLNLNANITFNLGSYDYPDYRLFEGCSLVYNCGIYVSTTATDSDSYLELRITSTATGALTFNSSVNVNGELTASSFSYNCYLTSTRAFNVAGHFNSAYPPDSGIMTCTITAPEADVMLSYDTYYIINNTLRSGYNQFCRTSYAYSNSYEVQNIRLTGAFIRCTITSDFFVECDNTHNTRISVNSPVSHTFEKPFIIFSDGGANNTCICILNRETQGGGFALYDVYAGTSDITQYYNNSFTGTFNLVGTSSDYSFPVVVVSVNSNYAHIIELNNCTVHADINVSGDYYYAIGCALSSVHHTNIIDCDIWKGVCIDGAGTCGKLNCPGV